MIFTICHAFLQLYTTRVHAYQNVNWCLQSDGAPDSRLQVLQLVLGSAAAEDGDVRAFISIADGSGSSAPIAGDKGGAPNATPPKGTGKGNLRGRIGVGTRWDVKEKLVREQLLLQTSTQIKAVIQLNESPNVTNPCKEFKGTIHENGTD